LLDHFPPRGRVRGLTETAGDSGLDTVMDEIKLGVAVELAKAATR
jgi:hypothetical protein